MHWPKTKEEQNDILKNGSIPFGIGSTIVVIPYDPPGEGEIKSLYPISSSYRFPSRWQPLSGIRRSRGSQFALRPIKTMSVHAARARVRRPPCHSLTRFLPPTLLCAARLSSFPPPFVFDPVVHPRVRLSRHPNVLFGNMSSERTADRPQSVAFSNVRVRPSVPLLQC